MMGRHHVAAGLALSATATVWVHRWSTGADHAADAIDQALWHGWVTIKQAMAMLGTPPEATAGASGFFVDGAFSSAIGALWSYAVPMGLGGAFALPYLLLAVLFVGVGSLLPDLDSKPSLLGRHLHLKGPHHGFTHTDWLLWILLMASIPFFTRALLWVWLGALTHDLLDGVSQAGRVPFYPLGRWRSIDLPDGSRCVVPDRPHRGYVLGSAEEVAITVTLIGICVLLIAIGLWS